MKTAMKGFGLMTIAMALGVGCAKGPMLPSAPVAGGGGATAFAPLDVSPLERALSRTSDTYFITQYHHERFNPNQTAANNANCGPTSLAMAVSAFGRVPPSLRGPRHAHDLILEVRKAMTGSADEGAWTYPVQVMEGARRLGLQSEVVFGLDRIRDVMSHPGRLVVVNLNPSPAYANALAFPYNGGHFALLTGLDDTHAYLSDPLAAGPITISIHQLELALTTPLGSDPYGKFVAPFNGGVSVWQ